jgi:intron-binding protein aquarius
MFPAQRLVDAEVSDQGVAQMEGVEHLGQYVFEMTKAKVEALKAGGGVLPPVAQIKAGQDDDDDDDDDDVRLAYGDGEVKDENVDGEEME